MLHYESDWVMKMENYIWYSISGVLFFALLYVTFRNHKKKKFPVEPTEDKFIGSTYIADLELKNDKSINHYNHALPRTNGIIWTRRWHSASKRWNCLKGEINDNGY